MAHETRCIKKHLAILLPVQAALVHAYTYYAPLSFSRHMNTNFPVAGVLAVGQQHYRSAQLNIKSEKRKSRSHIVAPPGFATVIYEFLQKIRVWQGLLVNYSLASNLFPRWGI